MRTLTIPTIVSTFQKAGVWPPNIEVIFKKMKKYSIAKPSSTKAPNSDSELPVYSLSKSILKTTPSNAYDIVNVGKAWKSKIEPHLSSPSRKDFDNFLACTGSKVYQSELWKGAVASIQQVAKENQKAADKARRYIPWKGALKVGDGRELVLQKNIRKADEEARKAEWQAKKAARPAKKAAQPAKRPRKRKAAAVQIEEGIEVEVEENVELEITLTNQSGKLPKKACKRRAIPKKDQDRKVISELVLDPKDEEFQSV